MSNFEGNHIPEREIGYPQTIDSFRHSSKSRVLYRYDSVMYISRLYDIEYVYRELN